MRFTLYRYILREIWPTFFASLLVFGLIMVATRMLSITEWIVNKGVHPALAMKLVFYLLPSIILFALPVATLIAVLIGFLRLSGDNEIIAMNSSGISLYQMLPPVVALSLASYCMASLIAFFGVPWGNRSFKDTIFEIAESRVDVNIRERVFYELFDDVMFYINSISPKQRVMSNLFVVDNREKEVTNTIVAREGRILLQPASKLITIQFRDGTVFMVQKDFGSARTMRFKTYDLNIGLDDMMSSVETRKRGPKEMYIGELMAYLKTVPKGGYKYNEPVIHLLERFTIPLAVFLMGLIGAPLGAHIRSGTRYLGVVLGLAVFLSYYMLLMGMRSLCETGTLPPHIGVWIPNLFLVACGIVLFRRVANDRSIDIQEWLLMWRERCRLRRSGRLRSRGPGAAGLIREDNPDRLSSVLERGSAAPGDGCERKDVQSVDQPYIGNLRARIFHRGEGRCGAAVSKKNRVVFHSRQEAVDHRYAPCRVCRP